jgi:predicted O-linked N-acetylglucosamine transferase (SPINDLY family)
VLICPGTPFKYAPEHDRLLVEIARRLGRCRLVFFTYRVPALSEKLRLRLARAFGAADFERFVSFVPWQAKPQFHGWLEAADVYLDTVGFSGFNSALQAIECGLPVVTREGRFMRGRLASGILKRLGLGELVAQTDDEYVEAAVRLAREPAYRKHISAEIAKRRGVLFNDRSPIDALEDLLEALP